MGGFITRNNNQHTYWLSINSEGNLYESSPEPREGFAPHVNEQTKGVSYWREYPNGVQGYIDDIRLVTRPNKQGQNITAFQIRIRDYDGGNDFIVRTMLATPKGGINRYVKSFVKYYKNIDFTKEVNFDSFKRKTGDQYPPSNLMIAYAPEVPGDKAKIVDFYFKKGVNGWPEAVDGRDLMGNVKKDYSLQDQFAMQQLASYIDEFARNIPSIRQKVKADREAKGLPFIENQGITTVYQPNEVHRNSTAQTAAQPDPWSQPQRQQPQAHPQPQQHEYQGSPMQQPAASYPVDPAPKVAASQPVFEQQPPMDDLPF